MSGTCIADLGDVLIMPYTGAAKTDKGTQEDPSSGYAARYSHANEKVKPGHYSVELDSKVKVELTASVPTSFFKAS